MSMTSLSAPDMQGYFWLPDRPNNRLPGRFHCIEDGAIELEVLGTFSEEPINNVLEIRRILGVSEKGKLVTLEHCLYKSRKLNVPGLAISTIHVDLALIGCHFESDEPITFDEITCHSEAFDEWFCFGKINVSLSLTSSGASISYSPPSQLAWSISIGAELTLGCSWRAPSTNQCREATITQRTWVGLRFPEKRPLDELLELVHRFNNFVSFVVDQTLPIQAVQAYSKDLGEEVGNTNRRIPIDVYYNPLARSAPNLAHISPPFPLFSFELVRAEFGDIISRWLNNYETFDSSFNLYFATKTGRKIYLENRFLMLVQALEALHRRWSHETAYSAQDYSTLCQALQEAIPAAFKEWLEPRLRYGNELSLRQRLKSLFHGLEPLYFDHKKVKELIARIIDTRNYLTHYDEALRSKVTSDDNMYKLCIAMETLLQVRIAMLCGFSIDQVIELCKSSELFKRKIAKI